MDKHLRVIGNYTVTEKLGTGSFAVVWKAVRRHDGKEVAMKEIETRKLNRQSRERMICEIAILKMINHPNILQLHEIIETAYSTFLVLEYCAGGDLDRYLKQHGRVTEAVARNFMWQIGAGLKVLHASNLIHRDLKPEGSCVYITWACASFVTSIKRSKRSKSTKSIPISTFGLSNNKNLGPEGFVETVCGSPLYMAPEVLQFQKYDTKADLWSLGAILFQLVTGQLPFQGNNHVQLLRNIKKSNGLQIPGAVAAELHPDCIDLCQRLLCLNPVERPFFDDFLRHKFMRAQGTVELLSERMNRNDNCDILINSKYKDVYV